jgi:hypothetical protein
LTTFITINSLQRIGLKKAGRSAQSIKNIMSYKLLLTAFCSLLIIGACHKHEEENNAPALTIENPVEGASLGGEIHIHGKVTDESLHEMEIKVTKDADGSVLLTASPVVHDKTEYSFDEHFTPAVSAETPVTLTITVWDHSDNSTTKTVKFSVKP